MAPRIGHNSPIWRYGGQARAFASTGSHVPSQATLLKADELGRIEIIERDGVRMIRRDIGAARWWARAFARRAAAREARALAKLKHLVKRSRVTGKTSRPLSCLEMSFTPQLP